MAARLISQEEPLPGYRLLERLGRGGFGEVWKVEAPGGLLKAMKFVFGDLDSAEDDGRPAEQELKALHRVKSIRHPYILSLERFDIIEGQLIIVMELADRNLWDRFRECRGQGLPGIPRDELIRYMEESAEALDLMNNHYQIQHLDVKPQNIFLVFNHIKVADFGLAKLFEGERGTVTGGVTPVYAAPETFEGWVSRYTDQYSLAIVYQELLTGTRPITGANTKQLLLQHLHASPDISPLPIADQPVIARGLAKIPDERWPTCMEMVRALKGVTQPTTPIPGGSAVVQQSANSLIPTRFDVPRPGMVNPTPMSSGSSADNAPINPTPSTPIRKSPTVSPGQRPPLPDLVTSKLIGNPGRPTLVTPRLVTQQGMGTSGPGQTIQRNQIVQTARMSSLGIAPMEKLGPGALMPAIVIAVGQAGLGVLRRFRKLVRDRFGDQSAFPIVRFLYLDTDPDAVTAATQGAEGLDSREVIHARLNRPAHYLQESGSSSVESWLAPGLLYKLPKNPGPANGVRAFGRLALCDNYRVIAQRLRQEIETFLNDDPLEKVAQSTGLGLRSNRARAYVISGLGGGTGSGMLVDLAYILRHELKSVGYSKPETVGVFLAPPADPSLPKSTAISNTYAALTEISHFTSGARYQCRFDANEAPIIDSEGPYTRCSISQLPKMVKEREQKQVYGQVARELFVELLTPTGRVNDSILTAARLKGTPSAQLYGIYRLTWPRTELLNTATRRFNQRLLQRWAGKETVHLKEPIRRWLAEQWKKLQLEPSAVIARYTQAACESLREDPIAVFDAAVDTLRTRTPGASRGDPAAISTVLDQLLKLVGRPLSEHDIPGTLEVTIRETDKKFIQEIEANLSTLSVSFIEQPQYRVAGAEEALNQMGERLKSALNEVERTGSDLNREVGELYNILMQMSGLGSSMSGGSSHGHRKVMVTSELLEIMRAYAIRRLQLAQYDAALALYRSLSGNIPEYIREVNFCRSRILELAQSLNAEPAVTDTNLETLVLPEGCKNLDEAADQFLAELSPEVLVAFDQTIQQETTRKFRGIVNVCLKPPKSSDFVALLNKHARAMIDAQLEQTDPATMLLRYRGDGGAVQKLLTESFEKAAPVLLPMGERPAETVLLAAPEGVGGDRLRQVVNNACPGVRFIPTPLPDDVVIIREFPSVDLIALPQMSAFARENYETQSQADAPPHTRADIAWTQLG